MADDICPICNKTVSFLTRTTVDGIVCHISCSHDYRAKALSQKSSSPNIEQTETSMSTHNQSSSAAMDTLSFVSALGLAAGLAGSLISLVMALLGLMDWSTSITLFVVLILSSLVQWALTKVFIGIAQDVRALRIAFEQNGHS